ncbi:MAG: site-2 protease family protein [Candidatus Levybacteria bacterium]|nr:site-2 protease family protein [Candidatus Levybacteria bacterium]
MLITLLVFLIILSVLVIIHELGHFLVAKKFGIKVEEFGFGLPPRVFGFKKGETLYSVNWLPIGGFVKLYGEDEAGGGKVQLKVQSSKSKVKELNRAFFARPVGQRAAVVVAGVVMNAILAIIIFYGFLFISNFKTQLPLLGEHKFFGVEQSNTSDIVINAVAKDSPAEKTGIKPLSKIVSIDGKKITDQKDLIAIINENKGKEIEVVWQDVNTNKIYKGSVVPRVSPPKGEGSLGISFFPVTMVVLDYKTPAQKVFSGIVHPVNLMVYNFDVMGQLIGVSIKEKNAAPLGEGVSGPVGIYSLVGNIVQIPNLKERVLQVLNLAGILSISLAFFNILPIPALDGGRLFFIVFEGVTRRKIPARFESWAHAIGMIVLLSLIALVTVHDLMRVFSGKGLFTP